MTKHDPTRLMTVDEFMAYKPPPIPDIIGHHLLPVESNMVVFGEAKSYKSTLIYHLGLCVVNELKWIGFNTFPCVVFIVQAEMPIAIQRNRLGKMYEVYNYKGKPLYMKFDRSLRLDTSYGKNKLAVDMKEIRSNHPKDNILLILDPLYKMMAGRISDEYDSRKFINAIDDLKSAIGFTTILVHHTRKTQMFEGEQVDLAEQEMSGSNYFNAWVDSAMRTRIPDRREYPQRMKVSFPIARHAPILYPVNLEIELDTYMPNIVYPEVKVEDLDLELEE